MYDSKKTKVHIYLKFYDFEYHPDKISQILDLEPTKTGIEGENFFIGTKKKIERIYNYNWWELGKKYEAQGKWVQEFIDEFTTEFIEPRKEKIREVMKAGDGEFSVCPYFYNDSNPGFYFEKEIVKTISDAGLPINLDIYCL